MKSLKKKNSLFLSIWKPITIFILLLLIPSLTTSCAAWLDHDPELKALLNATCPSTISTYNSNGTTGEESILKSRKTSNINDDNQIFISYRAGVGYEVPVADNLSFDTGLLISNKGNKTASGSGSSKFESKLNLVYIDIPLVAKYRLGQGGFNVYSGLQPAILVSAKNKMTFNGNSESQKVSDQYKTLDVGATIGGGYVFDNGIGINLGYVHGLTNILKDESGGGSLKTKNRMLTLGASYTFNNK